MPSKHRREIRIELPNGETVVKKIGAKSKADLKIKEKQTKAKVLQEYERENIPTFAEVADEWNAVHEKKVAYYTWNGYQAPLKDLTAEVGDLLIKDVTTFDIQRVLARLDREGKARHTIQLRKIVASLIFDYAVLKGYVPYNNMSSLKVPRTAPKKRVSAPSLDDIEAIKQAVDTPFGLFPYFILFTGCRRGEALALRYEDIDFINKTITINKVAVFVGSDTHIENRAKTSSGVRKIPLLLPLENVLDKNGKGLIFNRQNRLYTYKEFMDDWNAYRRTLGIVDITVHQLRHAFATFCYDAGLEPKDASRILGHSKVELTLNVYTHIREERSSATARRLNEYLSS